MAATPLLEEMASGAGVMIADLAGLSDPPLRPSRVEAIGDRRPPRRLSIYPASAGFDLAEELDHLCRRTIEPNVFFNPRFLAPAMPRLDDREVRLAVMRDGDEERSRLRLLMPFSVERPAVPLGVPVMRSWASPFGPLGTPLIDRDDPSGVLDDFLSILARPHLKLPQVLVIPDIRLDGAVAALLHTVTEARGLPLLATERIERPSLESALAGDAYLKEALRPHHYREFRRLKRRLGEKGALDYTIAREPADIRRAAEDFLALEASGWKGRQRSAMSIDRYRAAFVREAIDRLSQKDMCRIHALTLDGRPIASLVIFVEAGMAYTWKTAYDESLAAFSPGTLLMIEATRTHLDDPNIEATDSCAVPDHPVMSRLWMERRPVGTLLVGLTAGSDRLARQASAQLHLHRRTRNMARLLRARMRRLLGRD